VNDRSKTISKLISDIDVRTSYIRAKLGTLVPAQLRALRLKSDMPRQSDLAQKAQLHQSRISMFETPGAANVTLETLSRLAAAFKVGLVVKFVPFSEMLQWENQFSQDEFTVTKIDDDRAFIDPHGVAVNNHVTVGFNLTHTASMISGENDDAIFLNEGMEAEEPIPPLTVAGAGQHDIDINKPFVNQAANVA
jgi:transcriptional regulator with XRE-family HTH domain